MADKEKINKWDAEMPLIFIGFIREKQIPNYPKSIRSDVNAYLDDILQNIAIPKLVNALQSNYPEERLKVAKNLINISENNPDQLKIVLPHIEKALNDPDKNIAALMQQIYKNYQKDQKRKQTAAKRKKLTALRKKMDIIDINLDEGKISDAEYIIEQKKYLKLKREIELAEQI
ncbi:MAG: hypothetical protein ACTSWY_03560 [Promethearchaeota archaeon]